MNSYKDRVLEEYSQLEDRRQRLHTFCASELFLTLDPVDRELLTQQRRVMAELSIILKQRIDRF